MKKFYSLLVAAAMVLGATSCQQDAIEEVATNEPVSFTATLNSTRTELGEGNKVMWNADDKITIYTQENTAGVVFDGDATEAAATAKFTTTEEFAASTTGYFAMYPEVYTYYNDEYELVTETPAATYADGIWSVKVTLEDTIDGVAGSFPENNPMVTFSTNDKLSFQAATALLKFTYEGQETDGYADILAMGASLVGTQTLNYNTADDTITYTDGDSYTQIGLNGLKNGETYYIPIFPGTVSSFSFTLANGKVYSFEQEFEFKAGKIYTVNFPEGTPSPWKLTDVASFNGKTMMIENGFHVIKNVTDTESGYIFMDSNWVMLGPSKAVVAGEWQATQEAYTGFRFADCSPADIYLSADASQMCVVPAGEPAPSLYHLYAYNSSAWSTVNAYVWDAAGTTLNGSWPGKAMTKTMVGEVEYYAYDIPNEYIGQNINFIFNNGTAQTADLSAAVNGDLFYYTNGDVVEDPANPVVAASHSIYVKNTANWSNLYLYGWGGLETASWPGTKMTTTTIGTDTYYVYTYTGLGDVEGGSIIFNNGSGSQTNDITNVNLTEDLFYEVSGTGSNYKKIADPRQ